MAHNIGDRVKLLNDPSHIATNAIYRQYIEEIGEGWQERIFTIQANNASGHKTTEFPNHMYLEKELVAIPIFAVGTKVKIKDNQIGLNRIGLNRDNIARRSHEFQDIYEITRPDNRNWRITGAEWTHTWFSEECLEIVENAPETPVNRFTVGNTVQIIRDRDDLERIGTNIGEMDDYFDMDTEEADEDEIELYPQKYTIQNISGSGEIQWISLIGCTYSFKDFNLKLVMPEPAKKIEKTAKRTPTLEIVEPMKDYEAYDEFYDDIRRKIDKELYNVMKYELHDSSAKSNFRKKLQENFRGSTQCDVSKHEHGKFIIINYLKNFENLKKEVENLKKISQLEFTNRELLKESYQEEQKKRTILLINREQNLLFAEPYEKNCKEFVELMQLHLKNVDILQNLFKDAANQIEKIEELIITIQKELKQIEALKIRFDLSYKADYKKISLSKHRLELKNRIRHIDTKNKKIIKMQEDILENLKSFDIDDKNTIYRNCKILLNQVKREKV